MSLDIKLENDLLIDCIVYDEEGIEEQASTISIPKSNYYNENDYNERKYQNINKHDIKPLDPSDIKFGEIFLSNKGAKLYFMCYFCSESYFKIQDYVQHCVEDHNIDSWKVFNFLHDKKGIKETFKRTKQNKLNTFKPVEPRKLKSNNHDHTYDKNICKNISVRVENINIKCNKDEKFDIENLEKKLESSLCDQAKNDIYEEFFDDYECINEEYLEGHSNEENEIIKCKESAEDSEESSDFEDPSDLTKVKYCIHCLTKVINFKLHMRIKHFDLLHKCEIPCCYELFLTEKRLKEHMAIIHRDPEKPFACKNCDYKTNKKGSLDVHFKRIHLNIRNKKCSYCEKTFYDSGELKKHERVHTGERPAICYICGKGLRTTQDLNKHILRDHGEPTFCCKVCGKKFHLKETLLKHNFVHSNERPHICHVCGKGFKHVKYLREHMDLHSGTKKYECKICGKKFAQKNNYTGHQKIHNKTKIVNKSM